MAEQKHTPGPWRAMGCEIISDMWVVATVHWHSGNQVQDEANRHVIAAAPDMLAELKKLHRLYPHSETAEVIAKAEGRT